MGPQSDTLAQRLHNPARKRLEETGLYHSFRLPDGRILEGASPIDSLEDRLRSFRLPEDLRGKRVLDIGPWDGYFTFEMERRGADVIAIDYVDLDTFRALRKIFGSRARYERLDVYELDPLRHGLFDIVLCLGVLYHLKHPLLALEKICAVTRERAIVDTFVVDGHAWLEGIRPPLPYAEFYERAELGGQLDNWSGPTVTAVEAWIRAAGFAEAEVLKVTGKSARFAAHRIWRNLPEEASAAVHLEGISSHAHRGRCFQSSKEEYLTLWCRWNGAALPSITEIFPEIDGFGVAPLACSAAPDELQISLRVPPGLAPGRHSVRVKIGSSAWSRPHDFFMDLPPLRNALKVVSAQDGRTWKLGELYWENGGWLTVWVEGLSAEADPGNTVIEVGGVPHFPESVHPSTGQVNLRLRPVVGAGTVPVRALHRGLASEPIPLRLSGNPPPIPGLG